MNYKDFMKQVDESLSRMSEKEKMSGSVILREQQ